MPPWKGPVSGAVLGWVRLAVLESVAQTTPFGAGEFPGEHAEFGAGRWSDRVTLAGDKSSAGASSRVTVPLACVARALYNPPVP